MDNQAICFCQLIKDVLHPDDKHYLKKDVDWESLIYWARVHNILPIFLEGAVKELSYSARTESNNEMQEALTVVISQVKRTVAFLKLYKVLSDAGVYPLVIRGIICRQLYGKLCDHRPSGDEDILIRPSEYLRVKEILIANGYEMKDKIELEEQVERLQVISFYNPLENLHIELHLNLMGRENDARARMSDCFKEVFNNYREVEIDGVLIHTMGHQDHLLFLVLHAFKHFTLGGFGIRQVLDILLYQQQYGTEINLEQLRETLKEFRADVFWNDLICIGNQYLGFELPTFYPPNCPDELLDDMMQSGVFGNKTEAQETAARATMRASGNYLQNKKSNMFIILWASVFPSKQYMLDQAPYLQEKPWLLPFAWMKRWERFVVRLLKKDSDIASESVKIARRRMKLLKKYDLM